MVWSVLKRRMMSNSYLILKSPLFSFESSLYPLCTLPMPNPSLCTSSPFFPNKHTIECKHYLKGTSIVGVPTANQKNPAATSAATTRVNTSN